MAEVNDDLIKSTVDMIDIVSTRGAFRGDELLAVGQIRTALANSIGAANPREVVEPEGSDEQLLEG